MEHEPKMSIRTVYTDDKNVIVKTNHAKHPNSAVLNAVNNMQMNSYGAKVAEVYDVLNGCLHAQITRNKNGNIEIVYKREPRDYFDPIRRSKHALMG